MGQAKNRGSLEDRIKQAQEKKANTETITISEAMKKLNLPESAQFSGYVIHLPESDEFLANIDETEEMVKYAYAKTPIFAKKYENAEDAIAIAKEIEKHKIYVC